eukprot:gene8875-1592_t
MPAGSTVNDLKKAIADSMGMPVKQLVAAAKVLQDAMLVSQCPTASPVVVVPAKTAAPPAKAASAAQGSSVATLAAPPSAPTPQQLQSRTLQWALPAPKPAPAACTAAEPPALPPWLYLMRALASMVDDSALPSRRATEARQAVAFCSGLASADPAVREATAALSSALRLADSRSGPPALQILDEDGDRSLAQLMSVLVSRQAPASEHATDAPGSLSFGPTSRPVGSPSPAVPLPEALPAQAMLSAPSAPEAPVLEGTSCTTAQAANSAPVPRVVQLLLSCLPVTSPPQSTQSASCPPCPVRSAAVISAALLAGIALTPRGLDALRQGCQALQLAGAIKAACESSISAVHSLSAASVPGTPSPLPTVLVLSWLAECCLVLCAKPGPSGVSTTAHVKAACRLSLASLLLALPQCTPAQLTSPAGWALLGAAVRLLRVSAAGGGPDLCDLTTVGAPGCLGALSSLLSVCPGGQEPEPLAWACAGMASGAGTAPTLLPSFYTRLPQPPHLLDPGAVGDAGTPSAGVVDAAIASISATARYLFGVSAKMAVTEKRPIEPLHTLCVLVTTAANSMARDLPGKRLPLGSLDPHTLWSHLAVLLLPPRITPALGSAAAAALAVTATIPPSRLFVAIPDCKIDDVVNTVRALSAILQPAQAPYPWPWQHDAPAAAAQTILNWLESGRLRLCPSSLAALCASPPAPAHRLGPRITTALLCEAAADLSFLTGPALATLAAAVAALPPKDSLPALGRLFAAVDPAPCSCKDAPRSAKDQNSGPCPAAQGLLSARCYRCSPLGPSAAAVDPEALLRAAVERPPSVSPASEATLPAVLSACLALPRPVGPLCSCLAPQPATPDTFASASKTGAPLTEPGTSPACLLASVMHTWGRSDPNLAIALAHLHYVMDPSSSPDSLLPLDLCHAIIALPPVCSPGSAEAGCTATGSGTPAAQGSQAPCLAGTEDTVAHTTGPSHRLRDAATCGLHLCRCLLSPSPAAGAPNVVSLPVSLPAAFLSQLVHCTPCPLPPDDRWAAAAIGLLGTCAELGVPKEGACLVPGGSNLGLQLVCQPLPTEHTVAACALLALTLHEEGSNLEPNSDSFHLSNVPIDLEQSFSALAGPRIANTAISMCLSTPERSHSQASWCNLLRGCAMLSGPSSCLSPSTRAAALLAPALGLLSALCCPLGTWTPGLDDITALAGLVATPLSYPPPAPDFPHHDLPLVLCAAHVLSILHRAFPSQKAFLTTFPPAAPLLPGAERAVCSAPLASCSSAGDGGSSGTHEEAPLSLLMAAPGGGPSFVESLARWGACDQDRLAVHALAVAACLLHHQPGHQSPLASLRQTLSQPLMRAWSRSGAAGPVQQSSPRQYISTALLAWCVPDCPSDTWLPARADTCRAALKRLTHLLGSTVPFLSCMALRVIAAMMAAIPGDALSKKGPKGHIVDPLVSHISTMYGTDTDTEFKLCQVQEMADADLRWSLLRAASAVSALHTLARQPDLLQYLMALEATPISALASNAACLVEQASTARPGLIPDDVAAGVADASRWVEQECARIQGGRTSSAQAAAKESALADTVAASPQTAAGRAEQTLDLRAAAQEAAQDSLRLQEKAAALRSEADAQSRTRRHVRQQAAREEKAAQREARAEARARQADWREDLDRRQRRLWQLEEVLQRIEGFGWTRPQVVTARQEAQALCSGVDLPAALLGSISLGI